MNGFHLYALPVLVAAVIQWVIGALWYGVAFRKRWTVLVGNIGESKPGRSAFTMIASFALNLILSFVLANLIAGLTQLFSAGTTNFQLGVSVGILCWFGLIAPPMLNQAIFERRPANLFAINAAYWIVAMAISGGTLAAMLK